MKKPLNISLYPKTQILRERNHHGKTNSFRAGHHWLVFAATRALSMLRRPVLNIAGVMNACAPKKNALVVDKRDILLKIPERDILQDIQAVL